MNKVESKRRMGVAEVTQLIFTAFYLMQTLLILSDDNAESCALDMVDSLIMMIFCGCIAL
jgi:hypothetical protein